MSGEKADRYTDTLVEGEGIIPVIHTHKHTHTYTHTNTYEHTNKTVTHAHKHTHTQISYILLETIALIKTRILFSMMI